MEKAQLDELISYGIQREREAVQFYQRLQQSVHFTDRKKLLSEFEAMERGHIRVLEHIKEQIERISIEQLVVPEVEDLHISDYLVEPDPEGELEYQDILIAAMKREEKSFSLYSDLAENSANSEVKKLMMKLASEEAKHKLFFERLYDDEILTQD